MFCCCCYYSFYLSVQVIQLKHAEESDSCCCADCCEAISIACLQLNLVLDFLPSNSHFMNQENDLNC